MKMLITLLTGVVLCALSLACSTADATGAARKGPRVLAVASSIGSAARPDWRLGSPSAYKNLTVFPAIANDSSAGTEFITLDEGLRLGKVTITELGTDGRAHAISRRQRNDAAEVNRLALTNTSGKTLVLIAGEMILGGKQDRIVGHDCIIESAATPIPLDVFCVEHGRWSGEAAFGQSRSTSAGSTVAHGGGAAKAEPPPMAMALPSVREKAQAKKSQGEVWGAVAKTVTVNGTSSSTGDLASVYQDKLVNAKLDEYERAFTGKLSAGNIVGVVAAVGGKIVSADVFATHSLFQAYWPKMLKSYALEAVSSNNPTAKQVSTSDAEAFLARVQGSSASDGREGVYRLAENQSSRDASFELEYTRKNPMLVHFNRVSKD